MKKFQVKKQYKTTKYQGTGTGFGRQTTVGFYTQKLHISLFGLSDRRLSLAYS